LPDEEAEAMRQRIQDNRQVIAVYGEVLEGTSSNPERRALEEEQAQQVDRRATLLTRRDEIAVDMGLVPDAIALIQPASAAMELPGTDLARVLGTGIIVGAAAGLGLAHLLTVSRRTLANRDEPGPILGAPLIAEVPDFEQEGISSPVPVRDHPRSAAAEAYRFASLTLDVAARAQFARSIFVASSTLGRGKTTTVVNTALASAVNDRSVLVIDCDFGNQEASRLLVGDHHGSLFGLTDIIEDHAKASEGIHEVVLPTGASLHVMPRGTRPSPAATILQSTRARELVNLLTREYELVLMDGPPMLQVAYASTLAELAEGALIVAEHRSRHSELIELKGRLELVGTPVLGYIYNRSPLRREMTLSEGSMMDTLGAGLEERVLAGRNRDTG
jgi:Mrp family chromosome partitioning ATPase